MKQFVFVLPPRPLRLCGSLLICACLLLAGCARGPAVPKDAKLVWYGNSHFQLPADDLPSGTFYLVEEWFGKRTVVAAYRKQGMPIHFNGLKDNRRYGLYFVEAPATPTTRPAAGGGA